MKSARPARSGTGAIVSMPGRHNHATAPTWRNAPDAGCRSLHAQRGPRHTSWCQGNPAVRPLLARLGVPTMYNRPRRAWAFATARLDEVLVYAEHIEKRFVTVEDVAR